jgi:hypothetical protein
MLEEVSNSRFGVGGDSIHFEDTEALFSRGEVRVVCGHKSLKYLFSQKDLNLHQQRWLEFLVPYDCGISYMPGKGNVVTDALSMTHARSRAMFLGWKQLEFITGYDFRTDVS